MSEGNAPGSIDILEGNATLERKHKQREQAKRYYAEHREQIMARHAAYRDSHRMQRRASERARYYRKVGESNVVDTAWVEHLEVKASGMRMRYKTPILRLTVALREAWARIAELEGAVNRGIKDIGDIDGISDVDDACQRMAVKRLVAALSQSQLRNGVGEEADDE